MLNIPILKKRVYERHTGEAHVFEVFKRIKPKGGAPYMVMLDGAFLATTESQAEAEDEVKDAIRWFDWTYISPLCFG